jgi:putative cardiolipin synthase
VDASTSSVLIISPYFVPQPAGVALLVALRARGVRVVVVTNSLAATDLVVVHTGYAPYRTALLEAGVELWEVKPDASFRPDPRDIADVARSVLHAKVLVFDRETLFVGSFNLDPRSLNLNTEMGVIVSSTAISNALFERISQVLPDEAYRLRLAADGALQWVDGEGADAGVYDLEPQIGFGRGLMSLLLAPLPIEDQL